MYYFGIIIRKFLTSDLRDDWFNSAFTSNEYRSLARMLLWNVIWKVQSGKRHID